MSLFLCLGRYLCVLENHSSAPSTALTYEEYSGKQMSMDYNGNLNVYRYPSSYTSYFDDYMGVAMRHNLKDDGDWMLITEQLLVTPDPGETIYASVEFLHMTTWYNLTSCHFTTNGYYIDFCVPSLMDYFDTRYEVD